MLLAEINVASLSRLYWLCGGLFRVFSTSDINTFISESDQESHHGNSPYKHPPGRLQEVRVPDKPTYVHVGREGTMGMSYIK